jgi:hypothetical protein
MKCKFINCSSEREENGYCKLHNEARTRQDIFLKKLEEQELEESKLNKEENK